MTNPKNYDIITLIKIKNRAKCSASLGRKESQMNNEINEVSRASVASQTISGAASGASALKSYLLNSYETNVLKLRCPFSGKVLRTVSDEELLLLAEQVNYSLSEFAKWYELAYLFALQPQAGWLNKTPENLAKLINLDPLGSLAYQLKLLCSQSGFYRSQRKLTNGQLTTDGTISLNLEFYSLCEKLELLTEHGELPVSLIKNLTEQLLLLNCMGATSVLESLVKHEISLTWFASNLSSGANARELLAKLISFANRLISQYKIKNGLLKSDKLTIKDISLIGKRHREKRELELARLAAARESQQVKRFKTKTKSYDQAIENILAELDLNSPASVASYANELNSSLAKATPKQLPKLINLKAATLSKATLIKTVKLNLASLAKSALPAKSASSASGASPLNAVNANANEANKAQQIFNLGNPINENN